LIKLDKKKITKIGILGGTFDPPHKGHVYISKIALKKFKLNKLVWSVTKKNLLKNRPYLSLRMRIKLSKKITKNIKKISVQSLDNKIKSSNTYDLLEYMKKKNERSKLYFLIGADNLLKFHKWYKWKKINTLAKLVVFPRQNYSMKSLNTIVLKKLNKNHWIYVNTKKMDISSSLIRKFW